MNSSRKWICISLIFLCLGFRDIKAQVWGSYTFTGSTDGNAYSDNQWFPPMNPCVHQLYPSPAWWDFNETVFHPDVFGHQIGAIPHSIKTSEQAHECENWTVCAPATIASSHASYFVDGLNSSAVTLSYKIGPAVHGVATETLYDGWATADVNVTAMLDVISAPPGYPLDIYWSWDHRSLMGGSNFSENGNEDFCLSTAELWINGVEQFNGAFNFLNTFGFAELINQTGVIHTFVGQSMMTVQIILHGDVEVQDPPYIFTSGRAVTDKFQAFQKGRIRLSLGTPNPLTEPDSLYGNWMDFSVDVGGDAELSDTPYDSNEVFDPADIYVWHTPALPSGGADGKGYEMDDSTVFGFDPNPNPPDLIPPATGVPCGSGIFNPFNYMDIDDYDFLDFYISEFGYGPGLDPIGYFLSGCVYETDNLYISFDDDAVANWANPASVPANSNSPLTGDIFGQSARHDEVIRLNITYPGGGPQVVTQTPFQSEQELHASLGPNPTAGNNLRDDDVDGLDIRDGQCNVLYFTVDHEANFFGFLPGAVYMKSSGGGVVSVIDPQFHLGLPFGVDLDAIEFAWVENLTGLGLALLFSVDMDDPSTADNESGGLDPRMIYYSYLNGTYSTILAQPLSENIDALAVWKAPLFASAPCNPVSGLTIRAVAGGILQHNFTAPQVGTYHLYGTTNQNLIALPPSPGWNIMATVNALVTGQQMQINSGVPASPYMRFAVVSQCP